MPIVVGTKMKYFEMPLRGHSSLYIQYEINDFGVFVCSCTVSSSTSDKFGNLDSYFDLITVGYIDQILDSKNIAQPSLHEICLGISDTTCFDIYHVLSEIIFNAVNNIL